MKYLNCSWFLDNLLTENDLTLFLLSKNKATIKLKIHNDLYVKFKFITCYLTKFVTRVLRLK